MRRLIFNLFLIFTIHEIFSTVAATQYDSCPLDRKLEDLCSSYTYTVVRPILDYFKQVRDDLKQTESKDTIIKELRDKLVRQEENEALIKELKSQIEIQNILLNRRSFSSQFIENYEKCKDDFNGQSINLTKLEFQLQQLNSRLSEREENIGKLHKKLDFQVEDHKKQILKKDKDLQLCQVEVEKLNNLQSQIDYQIQTIDKLTTNSKLFENYDKCKDELANESKKFQIVKFQLNKLNFSLIEKDEIISRANLKIQKDLEDLKAIELKLEQSQIKLRNKEKEQELCQSEVDKLNRTAQNSIPSNCIPFGEAPGVHQIIVSGLEPFDVLCDSQLAGPGWLVMQQRVGGNENFNRSWVSYRDGFGSLDSDFFLGLEKIHRLTNSRRHELYIHLVVLNGTTYYARYDDFKVSDEDNGYALSLGKFVGNAGDMLIYHEDMKFSTFDRDNDLFSDYNCALGHKSGWWYNKCFNCNLNIIYGKFFYWFKRNPLQKVKMLIRPKD